MGQPGVIHSFVNDNNYSFAASDEPFWDAVYRKAFPNMVSHIANPIDSPAQRMGIDRSILLTSGKTLYVDEKKRREVYDDVLLEYLSNDKTGAPGWIEKDLNIDYIAYAFMPTKQCLLLPWPILQRAWSAYGNHWKATYFNVPAKNPTYTTYSVAVPIKELRKAIGQATLVKL